MTVRVDPEYVRPSLERLLEFENEWPGNTGPKEVAIRDVLHMGPVRYYQLLNSALDDPRSLEIDAVLIHRLQDARTTRLNLRQSRRFERPTS